MRLGDHDSTDSMGYKVSHRHFFKISRWVYSCLGQTGKTATEIGLQEECGSTVGYQVYGLVCYGIATPLPVHHSLFSWYPPVSCRGLWIKLSGILSLSLSPWSLLPRMWRMQGGTSWCCSPLAPKHSFHDGPPASVDFSAHTQWFKQAGMLEVKVEDKAGGGWKWVRNGLKHPHNKENLSSRGSRLYHDLIIIKNYPDHCSAPAHFMPFSLFLSHYPHLLSLPHQVFPRWFCWMQKGTWSRDRAAWKCWTTRSAGSFPGTLDLCSSWVSPTPCSCTKGPASSCLSVSGPHSVVQLHVGLQCGARRLWKKWHSERSIVK